MTSKITVSPQPAASAPLAVPALKGLDLRLVAFILLHIPLGVLVNSSGEAASLYAYVALAICAWIAASKAPLKYVAFAGAYIVGAETAWRMTRARIPWETGKYALCAICVLALLRTRPIRMPGVPIVYFIFLIPGALITLFSRDLGTARDQISFNLAGPLALTVGACFFANLKLSRADLRQLLLFLLASSVVVVVIVFTSIFLGEPINWGDESNFQATGGFGPNQVSAAVGLAALAVWLLIVYTRPGIFAKVAFILTCVGILALDVLTFSRGGVYTALVAGLAIIPLELVRGRQRSAIFLPLILAALLSIYVVLPQIDELTGGAASERFMDPTTTGRDVLVEADLQLFLENPLMGVGVGISKDLRSEMSGIAAHTEYSRLLAEHGLLGIGAIGLLFLMVLQNYRRNWESPSAQSIVVAAALWALLIMSHSATRLVAPSFMFALIFAEFALDEPETKPAPSLRYRGLMAIR